MAARRSWRLGAIVILCLTGASCREPEPAPTELSEQMQEDLRLAIPRVGGPSEEFLVAKTPAEIATAAENALEDSGVRVVRKDSAAQRSWLLGKSLADRNVLVQALPVHPGRSAVRVTVEGDDALARELLQRLSADLVQML
ncbi:MAG: hypothetical protein MUC88_28620 [Planctomycetes bacterium]|jgi:hypothetical protein|nr:hypothetical protein [Planctomycetota bacterium]